MTTAGTTTSAEAERRAEVLISRYETLTASNPGFHYHLHMRDWEPDAADVDSVTSALIEGRDRWVDLVRLVSADAAFHVWRLRLEHPQWWIGGRVRGTTSLLAQVISELDNDPLYSGCHSSIGGVGWHWFHHTKAAVKALSAPGQQRLAAVLRRELLGRHLCMSARQNGDIGKIDIATAFPESEFNTTGDGTDLAEAIDAAQPVLGSAWADGFKTMLGDLDPITWSGLADVLVAEVQTAR